MSLFRIGIVATLVLNCFFLPVNLFAQDKEKTDTISDAFKSLLGILPEVKEEGEAPEEEIHEMSLEDLLDIQVVSASRKSQKISEAPAIIDVISEKDIRERGFMSVGEALQSIPGFFVTTDHVTHNASVRGINGGRGASSRILKVMIDGQPVSFRSTSQNFLGPELIPMVMVKQIEVIRGPASALYGANAFLGVVNIITKSAEDLNSSSVISYGDGSLSNGRFEFAVGQSTEKTGFTLSFLSEKIDRSGLRLPVSSETLRDELNNDYPGIKPFDYTTENDFSRPLSMYGSFNVKPSFGKFTTYGYYQELDNNGRFYEKNPILNNTRINIRNLFIKQNFNGVYLDSVLSANLSVAYSSGKIMDNNIIDDHPSPTDGFNIKTDAGYKALDLIGDLSFNISDRLNFMIGADNSKDNHDLLSYYKINKTTNDTNDPVITVGENKFTNFGLFTQGIWYFSPKGTFTGGFRYDKHNIYGNKLNYRLATVYAFSDKLYTKLLYGTSFRAPTPSQLFSPNPPYNSDDGIIGNASLSPEIAKTVEASIGITPIKNVTFQLNGFRNLIDSIIVIEQKGGISKPINLTNIASYGIELSTSFKIKSVSGIINVSKQNSLTLDQDENEEKVKLFPDLLFNGSLNYTLDKLNISIQAYYIDDYIASQNNIENNLVLGKSTPYNINKYFLFDFTITSRNLYLLGKDDQRVSKRGSDSSKKPTVISISVKNLLNKKYSYPGFYKYDIPAIGRTVWFSLAQII
ncbi:MAG: TonB-dependent receptor [Bacteroidia bacterium]|nr:TonB-dependent receptor [Bacteroidia bacterium]